MIKELLTIPSLREALDLLLDPQTTNRVYFYDPKNGTYKKVNNYNWSLDVSSLDDVSTRLDKYALFLQREKES